MKKHKQTRPLKQYGHFLTPAPKNTVASRDIMECVRAYRGVEDEDGEDYTDQGRLGQLTIGVSKHADLNYWKPRYLFVLDDITYNEGQTNIEKGDYFYDTERDKILIFDKFSAFQKISVRIPEKIYSTGGSAHALDNCMKIILSTDPHYNALGIPPISEHLQYQFVRLGIFINEEIIAPDQTKYVL